MFLANFFTFFDEIPRIEIPLTFFHVLFQKIKLTLGSIEIRAQIQSLQFSTLFTRNDKFELPFKMNEKCKLITFTSSFAFVSLKRQFLKKLHCTRMKSKNSARNLLMNLGHIIQA